MIRRHALGAGALLGAFVIAAAALGAMADPAASAGAAARVTRTPWQWPLAGQPSVVRGFEPPVTSWGVGHRGVDLGGQAGLAVRAAGAGIVGYAGPLAGRGVVSVLHAGALRTTYEPLTVSVHAGERVAAGAVIGYLVAGHPRCPATTCLHWGLLRGETYLDPLALLGIGRVRLLPLDGVGSQGAAPVGRVAAVSARDHESLQCEPEPRGSTKANPFRRLTW